MATNGEQHREILTAQYRSPNGKKEFSYPLSTTCSTDPSVAEKTAYLSELRSSTKKLQENINTFLTEKMDEDKARAANKSDANSKAQDEVEEDNYGEEVVDED